MVFVLVSPLLRHSLLSLTFEAKLILVPISPTIATMKLYGLRLRLGMRLLFWFLSTRLLNRFLLTRLLTLFPKEYIPQSALELDRLLELICGLWEYRRIWGCVKFVSQRVGLRNGGIFVVGFSWSLDITNFLSSLTTTLSNLL
jgi:hypothetical protein